MSVRVTHALRKHRVICFLCRVALWSLPSADKDSKKGSTKSGVGGKGHALLCS